MIVYQCTGCGATANQPLGKAVMKNNQPKFGYAQLPQQDSIIDGPSASNTGKNTCVHCHSPIVVAGPMWGAHLHDHSFIDEMLSIHKTLDPSIYGTLPRIQGMLTLAKEELLDVPFFVNVQSVASKLKASSPPHRQMISAICNLGYRASYTHAQPGAIKTDAPYGVLLDIMKAWIKQEQNGVVSKNLKQGSAGYRVLQDLEPKVKVSFEDHPRALELETFRKSKLLRFQINPTKNWGPKPKASG